MLLLMFYPKFKLPKYTDISVSTKLDLVNDKDIEEQIDNLLNQFSTYEIMNEKKLKLAIWDSLSTKHLLRISL